MKHLLILVCISILSLTSRAFAEGPTADTFKLGAVVGNIGLTDSAYGSSKNGIGLGGIFGYSLEDELSFEMAFIQSSHDKLDHQDISLGVQYYFYSYEPFYYGLTGGVSFTTNEIDNGGVKTDDTAFGLFIGAGADVYTKRSLIVGLQARYYKMFGSEVNISGANYKLVDNYYAILARVLFQF
jgi:hypothetical protein